MVFVISMYPGNLVRIFTRAQNFRRHTELESNLDVVFLFDYLTIKNRIGNHIDQTGKPSEVGFENAFHFHPLVEFVFHPFVLAQKKTDDIDLEAAANKFVCVPFQNGCNPVGIL